VAWTVEVSDEFAKRYRELMDDAHESVNFLKNWVRPLAIRMWIPFAIRGMQT